MATFVSPNRVLTYTPLILLIGVTSGCDSLPQLGQQQPSVPQASAPQTSLPSSPLPPAVTPKPAAKPIIFTLSVSDPLSELKIKPGMFIQKGQIIADKENERLILTTKKKNVASQIDELGQNSLLTLNTAPEEKAIASAQEQISVAEAALRNYQQDSPWTDFARNNLPLAEEEVKLTRLNSDLKRAQNNLQAAQSKLEKKQNALQNYQKEQVSQKTQLQQELIQLEQQLLALKPIPAPQSGTITKIDLPKAALKGQPAKVVVTLVPGLTPKTQPALEGLPSTPGNTPSNIPSPLDPNLLPSPDLKRPSSLNSGSTSPILPATE